MELKDKLHRINPDIIALKEPTYLLMEKADVLKEIEQYSADKNIPIFIDIDRYNKARSKFFFENVDGNIYKRWRRMYHLSKALKETKDCVKVLVGGAHFLILDRQREEEKIENPIFADACVPAAIKDLSDIISSKKKNAEFYILGDIILSNKNVENKVFHVEEIVRPRFCQDYVVCSEATI